MTEKRSPAGDFVDDWTDAERDVWSAWSEVGQDLSQPGALLGYAYLLDAMETSVRHVAWVQSSMLRVSCEFIGANPLMPSPARAWMTQASQPVIAAVCLQQHMIAAWFGAARQLMVCVAPPRR